MTSNVRRAPTDSAADRGVAAPRISDASTSSTRLALNTRSSPNTPNVTGHGTRSEETVTIRPRDRVLNVYGSFVRDDDGWIAAGDLITLMGELGVNSQAVRSAVSRMKRSGLLVAERVDRRAGYALSARGAEILEDGDRRIFGTGQDRESERWVLALFSVPEADRKKRYLIRSCLAQLGFAPGPASSWVAPEDLIDEARHMLEREGLGDYVTLFVGAPHRHIPTLAIRSEPGISTKSRRCTRTISMSSTRLPKTGLHRQVPTPKPSCTSWRTSAHGGLCLTEIPAFRNRSPATTGPAKVPASCS